MITFVDCNTNTSTDLVPLVPQDAHQLRRQRFVEHSQHRLQIALVAIGNRAAFHVQPGVARIATAR
jgi:hypothetical protein